MDPGLQALAVAWGFVETPELQLLHARIVDGNSVGRPSKDLWVQYLDLSDPIVDFPVGGIGTARARAGRQIVQALMWLEAGNVPAGISNLMVAQTLARSAGWSAEERLLTEAIERHGTAGEQRQAEAFFYEDAQDWLNAIAKFEEALTIYRDAEQDTNLSDLQRGILNHHIAECYLGLLRLDSENTSLMQEQVVGALESASMYLVGTLEFIRTQALLDQVSQQEWWDAAVERQQS